MTTAPNSPLFKTIHQSILFLVLFGLFYGGSIAIISLAAPSGYHSPFIEKYGNVIGWLRETLIVGTIWVTKLMGYAAYPVPENMVYIKDGAGILIGYDCIGYGVYSFWMAYVLSGSGSWKAKLSWGIGGLLLLWILNVLRMSLTLIAEQTKTPLWFGWDNHTWFNIAAYTAIFAMMIFYERGLKKRKIS